MGPDRFRPALLFTFCAGTMDTLTGLLLLAWPARTVALFGAGMPAGDDILLRFVGAFVAGVGSTYLWALAAPDPRSRGRRVAGVWGATAVVRLWIAVFIGAAVALGRLDGPWLVVGATDALLALVQGGGLRAGWIKE